MKLLLKEIEFKLANNVFVFVVCLIVANIIIIKIPFHRLFINFYGYEIARSIERSIHGFIIIIASIFLIGKLRLANLSGIRLVRVTSPWLLIIPFIYPMSLGIVNFSGLDANKIDINVMLPAILAIVLKSMAEEYCFRGLLQSYLIKRLNNRISLFKIICLSAFLFAIMHIINISRYGVIDVINQVIAAFFAGVFFGSLLIRTNNVFLLGIIHGCINLVFMVRSLVNDNVQQEYRTLYSFSDVVIAVLRYSLVFSPLFFIGFLLVRRRNSTIALHAFPK